jgi:phosphatidylglycerophosphate synthase
MTDLVVTSSLESRKSVASGSTGDHQFKQEVRVQTSLLTPLERRCLSWIVARLPRWVTSDQLTLLGLSAMLAGGGFYLVSSRWTGALWLVNVCLAINWFGDSLDGTLARARNKQRPRYGYYVDHVIDVLGILALVCGLAGSGLMSWTVALAVLVTYYLLSIDIFLATHSLGLFRMSFFKFGPTELRVLLAIGNIKALLKPTTQLFNKNWLFFDVATVVAIALMAIVIVVSVTRNTITLYRAERI